MILRKVALSRSLSFGLRLDLAMDTPINQLKEYVNDDRDRDRELADAVLFLLTSLLGCLAEARSRGCNEPSDLPNVELEQLLAGRQSNPALPPGQIPGSESFR